MFNKLIITFSFCLAFTGLCSQDCNLSISGVVRDHETEQELEFVNVYIQELGSGTSTDSLGRFSINGLCKGDYHIVLSHIGCDPVQKFVVLNASQELKIELEHSSKLLEGVVVTGNHSPSTTMNSQSLSEQTIKDQLDRTLAGLLDNLSGVNTLRNGAGIAKPIVHGLYGNRITILNNGVAQSGQQWGNDHSPEIDPLIAGNISVIKGVSALEYPGSNLGSVVLVEPSRIKKEPHLHGSASYAYTTNGRGSVANAQVYRSSNYLDWKINGTFKRSGDLHTPDYYLNNTGIGEASISIQVQKEFSEKLYSELYVSSFNTVLGVLRGSHIGNLSDLESAFTRSKPFFTEENFSYRIDAPRQQVNHHLFKSHSKYFLTDDQWLTLTLAGQYNNRKEFDVRRSGRSDLPALSLQQFTYFGELKYSLDLQDQINFRTGVQVNTIDNSNNPETGILPLIPDYLAYEAGFFALVNKKFSRSLVELGLRYDLISQDVPTISNSIPREIVRYNNFFQNLATSLGWNYDLGDDIIASANIGFATRNPAINELYSAGLHQGVSGIEEGNVLLQAEKSLKGTVSIQSNKEAYGFEILAFSQSIQDYIYLSPSERTRLTIRGAFPVFTYQQTDAWISGLDISGQINLNDQFKVEMKYSYIRARDLQLDAPLIFIPPNNFDLSVTYKMAKALSFHSKKVENIELGILNRYVLGVDETLGELDFAPPPAAYSLLSGDLSGEVQFGKFRSRLFVKGSNLLNVRYRDYLNRQRYFADDLGLSITVGTRIKF